MNSLYFDQLFQSHNYASYYSYKSARFSIAAYYVRKPLAKLEKFALFLIDCLIKSVMVHIPQGVERVKILLTPGLKEV